MYNLEDETGVSEAVGVSVCHYMPITQLLAKSKHNGNTCLCFKKKAHNQFSNIIFYLKHLKIFEIVLYQSMH